MKLYLGGPMFDLAHVRFNLALAGRIRALGYAVYCPNENAFVVGGIKSSLGIYTSEEALLDRLAALLRADR